MDPQQEIPERSHFWFNDKRKTIRVHDIKLLDKITLLFGLFLVLFAFIVLWPVVSQVKFEEAFSVPLMPLFISMFSSWGFESQSIVRVIFMGSFMLSTAGVYLLVRELTRRQVSSILATLIYMLPPVPIFVIAHFGRGLSPIELASASSFLTVMYGNGGLLGFALIPFASILFLKFLKSGDKNVLVLTVLVSTIVLLTDQTQSLSLLLVFGIITISEFLLGMARLKIKRLLQILFYSLGLVLFWYFPIFFNRPLAVFTSQTFTNLKYLFPLPFILGVLGLIFSFVFFGKREKRQGIFISFLLLVVFLSLILGWLFFQHSYVSHPNRLVSNLNMFGAIVVSLALTMIFDQLRLEERIGFKSWNWMKKVLGGLFFGIFSFLFMAFVGLLLAPLIVYAISGPYGVWTKIRLAVIADKQEGLAMVGGNFHLIARHVSDWGQLLGIVGTLIVAVLLLSLWVEGFLSARTKNVKTDE
jgi:hypothetical protein